MIQFDDEEDNNEWNNHHPDDESEDCNESNELIFESGAQMNNNWLD